MRYQCGCGWVGYGAVGKLGHLCCPRCGSQVTEWVAPPRQGLERNGWTIYGSRT